MRLELRIDERTVKIYDDETGYTVRRLHDWTNCAIRMIEGERFDKTGDEVHPVTAISMRADQ